MYPSTEKNYSVSYHGYKRVLSDDHKYNDTTKLILCFTKAKQRATSNCNSNHQQQEQQQ